MTDSRNEADSLSNTSQVTQLLPSGVSAAAACLHCAAVHPKVNMPVLQLTRQLARRQTHKLQSRFGASLLFNQAKTTYPVRGTKGEKSPSNARCRQHSQGSHLLCEILRERRRNLSDGVIK